MLICELYKRFKEGCFRYNQIVEQADINGTGYAVTVKSLVNNEWAIKSGDGKYRLTEKSFDLVDKIKTVAKGL
jgi:predicted transcriptional regulator